MNRTTLTNYCVNEGTDLHICPNDCEIFFNDYSSGETVTFEGLSRETVNRAIHLYVVNSPKHMSKEQATAWLKKLHDAVGSVIKEYETKEESQ